MMQLEIGGERHDLPVGETTLGSDPGCAIRLTGEQVEPRHALITNRTGTAAIRRSSPVAHVTVNGIQLGAEPTPILHGDRIVLGHLELRVVDTTRVGSTQFVSAVSASAVQQGFPQGLELTGGRLVSLTDGREYSVGARPLVLGRDADCDVVIEHNQVSRRHAEVIARGPGYILVDLSTNGTWVNDDRIDGERTLSRADLIKIGNHEFRFYADAPAQVPAQDAQPAEPLAIAPPPPPPLPGPVRTPPHPPLPSPPPGAAERLNDTLFGSPVTPARVPRAAAPAAPEAPSVLASFLVRSGPLRGTRLAVRAPVVNIGRNDYNDLVVNDESVSGNHAKLQRREGIWILTDLGSTNGTFVDEEGVVGESPLAPGAGVRFGRVQTLFEPSDDDVGITPGSSTRILDAAIPDAAISDAATSDGAIPDGAVPETPPEPAVQRARPKPVVVTPPPRPDLNRWLIPILVLVAATALASYCFLL